jgi:hypothetical protein
VGSWDCNHFAVCGCGKPAVDLARRFLTRRLACEMSSESAAGMLSLWSAWLRKARLLVGGALLAICGCGEAPSDLIPVGGIVTLDGQPLTTGTVSLRADRAQGNTTPHQPTGRIDPQGRFEVFTTEKPGAPPGWYKVVVFASSQADERGQVHPGMPQSLIDTRYNDPDRTPLAFEVRTNAAPAAYDLPLTRAP